MEKQQNNCSPPNQPGTLLTTPHLVPDQLNPVALLQELGAQGLHAVLEELAVAPHAEHLLVLQTPRLGLVLGAHWGEQDTHHTHTHTH